MVRNDSKNEREHAYSKSRIHVVLVQHNDVYSLLHKSSSTLWSGPLISDAFFLGTLQPLLP